MLNFLILSSGSKDRFWPLSTKENPKQLLKIFSNKSLLRMSFERLLPLTGIECIYISTDLEQVGNIKKEIPEFLDENIIIEPMSKDTGAAILYGTAIISKYDDDATICVITSDHIIKNESKFREIVKLSNNDVIKTHRIICLASQMAYPETKYEVIEMKENISDAVTDIISFKDEPSLAAASKYFASGNYAISTGIIIYEAKRMISLAKDYSPEYYTIISQIIDSIAKNEGEKTAKMLKSRFQLLDSKSIQTIILRKVPKIAVIRSAFGWNDIGNYLAIAELFEPNDENLNIILNANVVGTDSNDNIIISENPDMKLALIGIRNKIVVYTKDNILICEKSRANDVKQILRKF